MVRLAHLVTACALTFLLVGCGDDSGPSAADDKTVEAPAADYPDFIRTEDGDLLVNCGGLTGWPVSVMADGLPGVLTDDEAEAIFTDLMDTDFAGELKSSFLSAGVQDTEWRVLRDDGDAYTFGLGDWTADGPAEDAYEMSVQDHTDGWKFASGGGCNLEPLLEPGNTWVEMHGTGLDRSSTEPTVTVNEITCTSARDPSPFLHDPYVVETDESVTVYWTSTPPTGAQECPGNPEVSRPIPLEAPLGDRQLLDGSNYPPSPVG